MAAPAATTNKVSPTSQTPSPPAAADPPLESISADELAAKAANKRYEGLVMVRTKAMRGKGAWYWAHLEPVLVHSTDTGLPKAVKLRCSLCASVFSASNPSRTASEHLKRGTCPNFASSPNPISEIPPVNSQPSPNSHGHCHHHPPPPHHPRKRSSTVSGRPHYFPPPTLEVAPPSHHYHNQQLILSGGKDDLGALALLEDSVKKLKSPKIPSPPPAPALTKAQVDFALDYLTDWVFDSGGSVSISSLEHPKFRSFLNQVGLPPVYKRDFAGRRLDSKYEKAKLESEARIREAMFFQIASEGWKAEDGLVNVTINLPNGTSLYRKAAFFTGSASSSYAEEVLWDSIIGICGNSTNRCVGIVADKFKGKALKNLEDRNPWMVNVPCQLQGVRSLIKDFNKELPLFESVTKNCFKLARFVNENTRIRKSFQKYQMQEYGHGSGLLRLPPRNNGGAINMDSEPRAFATFEDVLGSARAVQMAVLDESNKVVFMEDQAAGEVSEMVRDMGFWNELEAVHSLIKLVKDMAHEIEAERPMVGQCLPVWDDIRNKIKEWCVKFRVSEGPVEKAVERRFRKNYHPAWAAAFVLDPLYLARDTSGGSSYLPPFKRLTTEQEKDVDRLITRLVSKDEAHIALMELMKWRTTGLDPVYARAVQMKERDPITGKLRIVNPQSRRLVWETHLSEFKTLGKVAVRLIFLRAASCGGFHPGNLSCARWASAAHGPAAFDRAQKLIFVAAHSKLVRRDSIGEIDSKYGDFFGLSNGEDDAFNDVLMDASQ
ncbi:hypothetical protein SAY86_000748 [Trapa natans]|uniref:DUF7963 domain-containing protein n=1 Tax=Trapa natans TaxID=22666 RepID=A0AAN7MAU9_TRANT|nr:hypothetical protein SAY86_000748 [Trapa natans]